ncbi:hypothetical protein QAD02_015769 [Eretmocerus hayati]|uniref:Uncharacterized protein n=1 Tax=Eretmocerus hayati TaxID=131215 RepID=A0ACC2P970_9HYME|nr:hypothetical protein QAD02_015769 [Eretmocerus hayati]
MNSAERLLHENDSFFPEFGETLAIDGSERRIIQQKCSLEAIKFRKKGSDLFNQRKQDELTHRLILSYYSKSIAYAPSNSEELALAYNNRSLLWLRLHKRDFCSSDIERALKITKSNELKQKLQARKNKCSNSSHDHNPETSAEISLSTASRNIVCGSDSITVEYNEDCGRHLVATRNIKAGEVILHEQTPYGFVDLHNFYLICSNCLKYAWIGIPCEYCVYTIYCSESCKSEAWLQYHDVMCPMLPFLINKANKPVACMLLNMMKMLIINIRREGLETVISEAEKIDDGDDEKNFLQAKRFDCHKFSSLYNLKSYFDEECEETDILEMGIDTHVSSLLQLLSRSPIINNPSQNLDQEVIQSSLEWILKKLFVILSSNGFKFEDVTLGYRNLTESTCISVRGTIVGPCSSLINHSCDPNTSMMYLLGPRIVMYTIRPVKKGEQLCISYGPTATQDLETRQHGLRNTFFFRCKCKPCVEDWPDLDDLVMDPLKMQMLSKKVQDTFGRHASMFSQPPDTWIHSKSLFDKSLELCNYVHQHFDEKAAFWLTEPYRWYIGISFHKFYCENVDLLISS